jgi:hypothetical protein
LSRVVPTSFGTTAAPTAFFRARLLRRTHSLSRLKGSECLIIGQGQCVQSSNCCGQLALLGVVLLAASNVLHFVGHCPLCNLSHPGKPPFSTCAPATFLSCAPATLFSLCTSHIFSLCTSHPFQPVHQPHFQPEYQPPFSACAPATFQPAHQQPHFQPVHQPSFSQCSSYIFTLCTSHPFQHVHQPHC